VDLESIGDRLADLGAYLTADRGTVAIPLFIDSTGDAGTLTCLVVCEPLTEELTEELSDFRPLLPGGTAVVVAFIRFCEVEDRIISRDVHTISTSPQLAETAMRHLVSLHTSGGVLDAGDPQIPGEAGRRRLLADYLETTAREITWRSMLTLPARLRAAARTPGAARGPLGAPVPRPDRRQPTHRRGHRPRTHPPRRRSWRP